MTTVMTTVMANATVTGMATIMRMMSRCAARMVHWRSITPGPMRSALIM
jgi:hypothetical protein